MHRVIQAKYVSEYKLLITFEDHSKRIVDLSTHLEGQIFEPLRDIEFFKHFSVNNDLDTVVWENGADFSPDFLYEIGETTV